jgi:hypothetical protein
MKARAIMRQQPDLLLLKQPDVLAGEQYDTPGLADITDHKANSAIPLVIFDPLRLSLPERHTAIERVHCLQFDPAALSFP